MQSGILDVVIKMEKDKELIDDILDFAVLVGENAHDAEENEFSCVPDSEDNFSTGYICAYREIANEMMKILNKYNGSGSDDN